MLCVENLSYKFGPKQALCDVSFTVSSGQFCALLGPNGAGKSTLFSLLTRLFNATQGKISIAGHDLGQSPLQALAQIGVVFQQTTLDLDLSVQRNLTYFAALQGIAGREADKRVQAALELLDMAERANERARDLNGGHRRRAEIARALLHRPGLLLLDEPTVGLDAASRSAITRHVHRLCQDTGAAVLWATHLTDEVSPEDRLLILHRGKLLADGQAAEIGGAKLSETFLGLTRQPA